MANVFRTARAERACHKYVDRLTSVAELVATLNGPGPFTLFVPIDAAFDRLSEDQQAALFADPDKLARMLMYHIVPGYYTTDDLLDRLFLKTLEGQRLRVWSEVSVVELGEEEIDASPDARSYIATDIVTPVVRASITINGGTGAAGEHERRQWDRAPHRQSAHPIIRYVLNAGSPPLVAGCTA